MGGDEGGYINHKHMQAPQYTNTILIHKEIHKTSQTHIRMCVRTCVLKHNGSGWTGAGHRQM